MENLVMTTMAFWKDKRVFITGHTGFKGSWLSLWLQHWGAHVTGYSKSAPTSPSMFEAASVKDNMQSITGDVTDFECLNKAVVEAKPDIIFHMAAQPLVRYSYANPLETFNTNVMGTANLLEAVRNAESVKVVVNITSDKCYENKEKAIHNLYIAFDENAPMGGHDPYSSSKGCAELVTAAFRQSYFQKNEKGPFVASARAGNVIGGGDWATDRLIPDLIRSTITGNSLVIRNPFAIRPWQHVLDSLHGYLCLAEALWSEGHSYSEGWNFGPDASNLITVENVIEIARSKWPYPLEVSYDKTPQPHESKVLLLDSTKAAARLQWKPKLPVNEALTWAMDWYTNYNKNEIDVREYSVQQIIHFIEL
jgi:CDP-glucose 4,6-dehydratase